MGGDNDAVADGSSSELQQDGGMGNGGDHSNAAEQQLQQDQQHQEQDAPATAASFGTTYPGDRVNDAQEVSDESAPVAPNSSNIKKTSAEHWQALKRNVQLTLDFSRGFETLRDMFDDQYITPDRIRKIQVLGEGAFATVEKAKLLYDGGEERLVAVKSLRPEMLQNNNDIESFATEVQLLRRLRHRNVTEFVGVGVVKTEPDGEETTFLVQEFMNGGTLKKMVTKQMLRSRRVYSNEDALRWMKDIAKALQYLHNSKPMIIHRDMKLENILLSGSDPSTMEAKLADFGLSAIICKKKGDVLRMDSERAKETVTGHADLHDTIEDEWNLRAKSKVMKKMSTRRFSSVKYFDLSGNTGSLMYMAPEVYREEPYNEKADVFSFGIIMCEVFQRYITLSAVSITGTPEELDAYAGRVAAGYRPPLHDDWPPQVSGLIKACWAQEPNDRPDMNEVVERLKEVEQSGSLRLMDSAHIAKHLCDCSIS